MTDSRTKAFKIISDERQWGIIQEYILSKFLEHRKRGEVPPGTLGEYLTSKLDEHQEPSREGIPRGEKIGFPKNKYLASILVGITNRQLKEIAKACGVSYGLLRKWRTEVDFKEACQNHRQEFVAKIIGRIKEEISIQEKKFDDYFNDRGPDPLDRNLDEPLNRYERILIDAKQFNEEVLNEINSEVLRIADVSGEDANGEGFNRFKLFNTVATVILLAEGNDILKPDPLLLKHLTSDSIKLLAQKKLSEHDKRIVVTTLKIIERYLDYQIT